MLRELHHHLVAEGGVDAEVVEEMAAMGYHSIEHVATAAPEELAGVPGLEGEVAMRMVEIATRIRAEKAEGTYVSPFAEEQASGDEEEAEEIPADLAHLGPLASLGPVPERKAAAGGDDEAAPLAAEGEGA